MQGEGITHLLQILFVGLLAGFEIAVHYGIGRPPQSVAEDAQIIFRQTLIRRVRILAPALYLPSLLLTVLVQIESWQNPGSWLRYGALVALLVWALVRVGRTVWANSATMEWNPTSPPMDWRAMVERAEQFHVVAAWAGVVAFVCAVVSTFTGR